MPRKIIAFDDETWTALDLYARESMRSLQELADEAFRDLLDKHGRPSDLKAALRKSLSKESGDGALKPRAAKAEADTKAATPNRSGSKSVSKSASRSGPHNSADRRRQPPRR